MPLRAVVGRQAAFSVLRPCLPEDHSRQSSADQLAGTLAPRLASRGRILDLGCGDGASVDFFRALLPGFDWVGLDVADSPEARTRTRGDAAFLVFDGTSIPTADSAFDLVFSRQVLEHVRHPDTLVREVARVLAPGGYFLGSVAYLEPYHSFSIFNLTPYGLWRVLGEAGLTILELRPGVDGPSLMVRQLLGRPRVLGKLFRQSPWNLLLGVAAAAFRLGQPERNYLKLQFAGHVCFLARKRAHPEHRTGGYGAKTTEDDAGGESSATGGRASR